MNAYGVLLFHTTSAVMRAEKVLGRMGLAVKLIPTPRQFSSDCGLAVRVAWEDATAARAAVEAAGLDLDAVRRLEE